MTPLRYRTVAILIAVGGIALAASGLLPTFRQAEAADPEPVKPKSEPVVPKAVEINTLKTSNREDEQALRKAGQSYVEALNKGDGDALTAFWTLEADYTDAAGKQFRGRDAIAAIMKEAMAGLKGYKAKGRMHSIKFLRPEVAIEDGSLEYTAPDGSRTANRYLIVWLKSEGRWLIGSARDLPAEAGDAPSLAYPRLSPFEWLVGEWEHGDAKNGMKLYCHWAPNKTFLLMDYTISRGDAEPFLVSQRVGWDPANGAIRSWVFDSLGGFGDAAWEREGNRWTVRSAGVLPDGGTGSAANSYEFVDPNTFVWRGTNRTVNGQPLTDSEVKFVRKISPK